MLSYRGEAPLSSADASTLFVVVQASLVRVQDEASWNLLSLSHVPVIAPLVGVRRYVAVASGGLVVSQGAWASFSPPSLLLPGSLAIDLPLGPVHLLPELRWDLAAGAFREVHLGAAVWGFVSLALHVD